MTLEDFFANFNKMLDEYQNKQVSDERLSSFMQCFFTCITEGTESNTLLKQSFDILLHDVVFIYHLRNCIVYVMAMTAAAIQTNKEKENDNNNEE